MGTSIKLREGMQVRIGTLKAAVVETATSSQRARDVTEAMGEPVALVRFESGKRQFVPVSQLWTAPRDNE